MRFTGAKIFGEDFKFSVRDICVSGGLFSDSSDGVVIDCSGLMMIPGLVDIHTHGAIGFESIDTDGEAIVALSDFYAEHGTTTFLPTLATLGEDSLVRCAENIARARKIARGAKIGGIHMEGPFFSEKYKGAQNPEFLRSPDAELFFKVNDASGGLVRLISIAPEKEGAQEFIKAVKPYARIAAGHTDADYDTMMEAVRLGLSQLTHSFNAMRSLHHRSPGALGAAIDTDIYCELISDGMHVHPAMVRMLYRAVGAKRLVLISDSVRPAYLPDGEYNSCGQRVIVKDGRATLADGAIAGSSSTLLDCMRRAVEFGIPLTDAVRCATYNPAVATGMEDACGMIKNGRAADFILLDDDLTLRAVYINGRKVK